MLAKKNRELLKKLIVKSDGNVHVVLESRRVSCHMVALNGCCSISFRVARDDHYFSDVDNVATRLRALWQIANHDLRVTDWRFYERPTGGALHFDFVKRPNPHRDQ